ncbi:D-alanyl-D-alanine carboxypeptidase family protein [Clostridium uliginosum]|uniref:D-alanyl-D-alanine carboxypeptidase n=1 Tax=Clostridium uliginosum TaxID=119641 RepID=A0A1I1HG38_9CLOT|nr:D-alanyl-D-alanine carboxypeptidase family protein [Clostridium uliginosum]SFC23129.1 D-alanyl-D-alanine carboxypeptidase [Clostridium uliginosum]
MRKIIKNNILVILISIILLEIFSKTVQADSGIKNNFRVNARCAIALDRDSGEVLFEQNGYEIVPMASTTKILTAIIAIEQGDLDKKVTISKKSSGVRGSKVGYKAGEEITLKELVFGLMFKSGNDAAIAIAEALGGSVEGFAEIMNHYAKGIGILDSHFESPHGLDSNSHYSSAYDLAILTSKGMNYDLFREVVGSKQIAKDKYNFTRDYNNINKILWLIPEANGVKTGYTGGAGKCLVSSVNNQGKDIIIVVLNCPDRWEQTQKIYKHVLETVAFENQNFKELVGAQSIE